MVPHDHDVMLEADASLFKCLFNVEADNDHDQRSVLKIELRSSKSL